MRNTKVSPELIHRIKERIKLEDVISGYICLNKGKAICPFHPDKHPSLSVQHQKQYWKCFGCGQHGDVFTFVQLIEGISFSEAVIMLGQQVGITAPRSARFQGYIQRKWQAKSIKLERLKTAKFYFNQAFLDRRDELLQLRRSLPAKPKWNSWNAMDYLADQLIEFRFDLIDQKWNAIIAGIEKEEGRIRHG
jgi:DNA primase